MGHPVEQMGHPVYEDSAPRAMFDEDQEQQNQEPPPMHRSKSSLGAQSRGIQSLFYDFLVFILVFFRVIYDRVRNRNFFFEIAAFLNFE